MTRYRESQRKPLISLEGRGVDIGLFHLGDEVQRVASALAVGETVPAFFAESDLELSLVGTLMNRAGAFQAVAIADDPHERAKVVVVKHLLHGERGFDGREVNERFSHEANLSWITGLPSSVVG